MKKSVLDRQVCLFENYMSSAPYDEISVLEWLESTTFEEEILELRSCSGQERIREIKSTLPAITPSGVFAPMRRAENLKQHSCLICIDIDGKENPHIKNWEDTKSDLARIDELAYCGLSASGNGLFLIFPIVDPDLHVEYIQLIEKVMSDTFDITIDKACKDVTRLRGVSYDHAPYFNHNAIPLKTGLELREKPVQRNESNREYSTADKLAFYKVLEEVTDEGLDITEGYGNWFQIGCVIANLFGEEGRKHFHQISQFHYRYSRRECDRQYNNCLKHEYNYGVGTLVHILKQYRE